MKLFFSLLALTLTQEVLGTHLETCECHDIQKLVNETVQEAVAGLENRMNDLIRSSINSTENQSRHSLEVKLITTMEKLLQPIQNQLNYHLPLPGSLRNSKENPAISCKDLYQKHPDAPSGYYWITRSGQSAGRVYCSMNGTCGGETGGWMRVANIDMTNTSQSCPNGLTYVSSPKRLCTSISECVSNILNTQGVQYSHVCGKIIGYQQNSPLAFHNHARSIDAKYVAGVSLTHSSSPRKHIWTFAGATSEDTTAYSSYQCRCMRSTAPAAPSYVGNDYFCDSAKPSRTYSSGIYTDDPLWDGKGCGSTSSCCSFNTPPWFVKELPSPTTDNIEMRVCYPYGNGNVLIETVELYVQ